MSGSETALLKVGTKVADLVYQKLLRRKRIGETARALITEIKSVEANGMLINIMLLRADTDFHQNVVGSVSPSFDFLRARGAEDRHILMIERGKHVGLLSRGILVINDTYFPNRLYEANADRIGQLDRDEAEAVVDFYNILEKVQKEFIRVGEMVDDLVNDDVRDMEVLMQVNRALISPRLNVDDVEEPYDYIDYRQIEQELKTLSHLAERLAQQKVETLEILGAEEDEFDGALTIEELENPPEEGEDTDSETENTERRD